MHSTFQGCVLSSWKFGKQCIQNTEFQSLKLWTEGALQLAKTTGLLASGTRSWPNGKPLYHCGKHTTDRNWIYSTICGPLKTVEKIVQGFLILQWNEGGGGEGGNNKDFRIRKMGLLAIILSLLEARPIFFFLPQQNNAWWHKTNVSKPTLATFKPWRSSFCRPLDRAKSHCRQWESWIATFSP